jgi:MFS family permease
VTRAPHSRRGGADACQQDPQLIAVALVERGRRLRQRETIHLLGLAMAPQTRLRQAQQKRAAIVRVAHALDQAVAFPEPLLKLRLFANRLFRDTNLISLVGLVPRLGAMFLGPLFLRQGQGRTALESGTSTFPEAFGVLLTVQIVGILYARVGPRVIVGCGLAGVSLVLLLFATCDEHTSLWTFRAYMFLLGVAMGGVFMPTTVASLATIARRDVAQASTLNTVVRQTGGALAPAMVTTALVLDTPATAAADPPITAYQHAYLALSALAAATAVFAFTLPDAPARAAAGVTTASSRSGPPRSRAVKTRSL